MVDKVTPKPRKKSGRTASKGKPNPIDVHVGSRVRLRRTLVGMSQEQLGEAIGLTFQQIQKYERGANRIGSSRLFDLCRVLNVPVSFFFDDMPESVSGQSPGQLWAAGREAPTLEKQRASNSNPMDRRDVMVLVRDYMTLPEDVRESFRALIHEAAGARGGYDSDDGAAAAG